MPTPYYSTECGLEEIMSKDIARSYEFNLCILWRHTASGRLFYGFDSGCSCPTPYENDSFDVDEQGRISTTLQEVTARNWEGAAQEMSRKHFDASEIFPLLKKYFEGK